MLNIKALKLNVQKLLAMLKLKKVQTPRSMSLDKKSSLSSESYYEYMILNNAFILANISPKLYGRCRKELTLNVCEKNADRIYSEIVLIFMMQSTFIPAIHFKTLTNERTINESSMV